MALVVAGVPVIQGYVLAKSAVAISAPADTNENTLASIPVLGSALGANGIIRITTTWTVTNNANAKTLRVRFSGASGTQYLNAAAASMTGFSAIVEIANRNSIALQVGGAKYFASTPAAGWVAGTSAVDTSALTSLVITGQKATAGDTLTLESYLAELFPS